MRYFRLLDELDTPKDRWFLKSLNVVDENKISVWKFVSPARIELPNTINLKMSIREYGSRLDFTFADFEVIVVNKKVADLLNEKECQLLPIKIEGIKTDQSYYLVIILNTVDCLDEDRSVFEKWQADDPVRPDKAGMYKSIDTLFVDSNKINESSIFRLGKSNNTIIVNEDIKNTFKINNICGVKFKPV